MHVVPGIALALTLLPHHAGPRCASPESQSDINEFGGATHAETQAFMPPPKCQSPWSADTVSDASAGSTVPSLVAGPLIARGFPTVELRLPETDTEPGGRPKAVQYSQGYYTRLTIHRYASYATLPLFAAEFIIGEKLYRNDTTASDGLRSAHSAVALAIGGLFAVNTVTGGWNFWQARHDPEGRTRRTLHSLLMFVSDAGFLATAATAPSRERERDGVVIRPPGDKNLHRNLAIASFSTALIGYAMMLIWK